MAELGAGTHDVVAQPVPSDRIVVRLDGGGRPASRTFAGTTVFQAFGEPGNFESDYEITSGGVVDGGISFLLWRNLAVGLDVSSYRSVNRASIRSVLPHPFFFDLPRSSTGEAGGLERQELGIHIRALWVSELADWLVVSVSSGPSLINARQDLVTAVEHIEVGFPFDEIVFAGPSIEARSSTIVGWNAGVDVDTFFLHAAPFLNRYDAFEHVGLGLLLRYVRGTTNLLVDDTPGNSPIAVDLGGLQVTAGLRFRF